MKLGYFSGMWDQVFEHLSADQIMALVEAGQLEPPELTIVLIPDDASLTELSGSDWDDTPAHSNASGVSFDIPGAKYIRVKLGQPWPDGLEEA